MTPDITSAAGDEQHDAKFNSGCIFSITLTAALGGLMFASTTSGHCFFCEAS